MWTNPETRLAFDGVSAGTLRSLATALRSGQLAPPLSGFALSKVARCTDALGDHLRRLSSEGLSPMHLSMMLEIAADATDARLGSDGLAELVWTGPESTVSHSRDTAAVVEELFSQATRSVIVSTFVIQEAGRVFAALASRLDAVPGLSARLFVHVSRKPGDTREDAELLRMYADTLRAQWPGERRPEVYYDPRSMSGDGAIRASWHAKCVLVDDEVSFVTSANFTEWAQQRNVEAGVLVRSPHFARQFRGQFDTLVQARLVRRLPGF